jgi:hypothetical protein
LRAVFVILRLCIGCVAHCQCVGMRLQNYMPFLIHEYRNLCEYFAFIL